MDTVNYDRTPDPIDVLPWPIPKGDDGVIKDCILVARMDGAEMVSVSLHIAGRGVDGPDALLGENL